MKKPFRGAALYGVGATSDRDVTVFNDAAAGDRVGAAIPLNGSSRSNQVAATSASVGGAGAAVIDQSAERLSVTVQINRSATDRDGCGVANLFISQPFQRAAGNRRVCADC